MFAGIPDFHAEICRSVQDGEMTWTEWRWSGTRSDGQAFEMRGVTLFEIADDQIVAGGCTWRTSSGTLPVSSRPWKPSPAAGRDRHSSRTAQRPPASHGTGV
ncbi:MAG TPA: nuclear transport factor 2 family protein, partial [Streptosporangiaceae bacterium]|nr:nuclear transport factor 2 family protein [Streptosporangiaceae bacterium]